MLMLYLLQWYLHIEFVTYEYKSKENEAGWKESNDSTKLGRDKIDNLYGLNSQAHFTLNLALCLQKLLSNFTDFIKEIIFF